MGGLMGGPEGAGSLAAATVRLRRAGRLPVQRLLPVALVRDRLVALVREPDTDTGVEQALARLSPGREGGGDGVGRGTTEPPALVRPSDPPRRPVSRPGKTPPSPRSSSIHQLARIAEAPSSTVDVGGRPGRRLPRDPSAHGSPGQDVSARPGAAPVSVPRDPALAELLGKLAGASTIDPRALRQTQEAPAQVRALRQAQGVMGQVAGTSAGAGAPRNGKGTSSSAPRHVPGTSVGQPEGTSIGPARGASPGPAQSTRSGQAPMRTSSRPVFVEPPVGLAGLAGWWETQSDSVPDADRGPSGWATDSTQPGSRQPGYGPDGGFAPWSADADTRLAGADQLRDLLERLLAEEALADGLELSDGSA